jgi:hypothetical protein
MIIQNKMFFGINSIIKVLGQLDSTNKKLTGANLIYKKTKNEYIY